MNAAHGVMISLGTSRDGFRYVFLLANSCDMVAVVHLLFVQLSKVVHGKSDQTSRPECTESGHPYFGSCIGPYPIENSDQDE